MLRPGSRIRITAMHADGETYRWWCATVEEVGGIGLTPDFQSACWGAVRKALELVDQWSWAAQ